MCTIGHPFGLHPSTYPEDDSDEGQVTTSKFEEERSGVPDPL